MFSGRKLVSGATFQKHRDYRSQSGSKTGIVAGSHRDFNIAGLRQW
jgi:hypothetical protein